MLTRMEIDGMKNGCFNMAKDEGISACREYRAALEAQGYRTWPKYFSGDLFIVEFEKA